MYITDPSEAGIHPTGPQSMNQGNCHLLQFNFPPPYIWSANSWTPCKCRTLCSTLKWFVSRVYEESSHRGMFISIACQLVCLFMLSCIALKQAIICLISLGILIISSCVLTSQGPSWLSWLFEKLILAMIIYFVLSIVNSMAQQYAKRLQDKSSKAKTTWRNAVRMHTVNADRKYQNWCFLWWIDWFNSL